MDLVTITDHDTIDGCLEFLSAHPDCDDFIVSEEVSCRLPDADIEVHLGVYGMTQRLHDELQPLRADVFDVTAHLHRAGVFFSLNHPLHFYRGQIPLTEYLRLFHAVPAVEGRNGTMLPAHNELITWIACAGAMPAFTQPLPVIGGSDAHTLRRIGRTWTEAPGASAEEFLLNLRAGRGRAGGAHGGAASVAADAYGVIRSYVASLLGRGPCDHRLFHRAACLAFSVVSLPAQFLPMMIAVAAKSREARAVRRAAALLRDSRVGEGSRVQIKHTDSGENEEPRIGSSVGSVVSVVKPNSAVSAQSVLSSPTRSMELDL